MFTVNTIVRPTTEADKEYSVCGNSVLYLARVDEVFTENENGNDMKIEVLAHLNPHVVGKKYKVNSKFFEEASGRRENDSECEWITIDAFKATDENMCCKGRQYHMGNNIYSGNTALGVKGMHVCGRLQDVFRKYDYDFKNRFFKVKATVKASDVHYINPNNTVLVAKNVVFVEEITDTPECLAAKRASMQ